MNKAAAKLTAVAARLAYERSEEACPEGTAALLEEMRESLATLTRENEILRRKVENLERRSPENQGPAVADSSKASKSKDKRKSQRTGDRRRIDSSSSYPSSSEEDVEMDPEIRAEEVRKEIAKEGMPAAVRPPIQGKTKIIDPAKIGEGEFPPLGPPRGLPASAPTPATPPAKESAEEGLIDRKSVV